MLRRTTNPACDKWDYYGGRGIRVCRRWLRFENFLADMGERPEGMTLDRKRTNGNYTPSNCRWATKKQQAANKRDYRPQARGAKLTPAQVREIRVALRAGELRKDVAARFNISKTHVWRIRTNKNWYKHG